MELCKVCGKMLKGKQKTYCSNPCKYTETSKNSYIDGRTTFRKRVLSYKEKKCEHCGSIEKLQVHHMDKAYYDGKTHTPKEGNHTIYNSKVLCSSCHRSLHGGGIHRFKKSICVICGKDYEYYPRHSRGKYCSLECLHNRKDDRFYGNTTYIYNCRFCQKKFETSIKIKRYCSDSCKRKYFYWRKKDAEQII